MAIVDKIAQIASHYASELEKQISSRMIEMENDDHTHHLIYRILGIGTEEGQLIDLYQNKGRFLYRYAGSFLEDATKACFDSKFPSSGSVRIPNTQGSRPRSFEIDCLVNRDAIEIKWRDATTDGAHVTKEHTRIRVIRDAGYKPIRIMFYYPNRQQAVKIQQTLETLYKGLDGEYYYGDEAWRYVKSRTDIDLLNILKNLAKEIEK